jgi:hypothetical protein
VSMSAQRVLRFKIVTSFIIAVLGAATFGRLLAMEPLSSALVLPLLIALTFSIAGLWRAFIYVRALGGAKNFQ